MPTSDEEVQKQRAKVDKLAEQLAEAEATRDARFREGDNDIRIARLQAEEERLTAQLAAVKEQGKASSVKAAVKEGVAQITDDPTTTARVQADAEAQAAAQEKE